jgi:hypothetical protein
MVFDHERALRAQRIKDCGRLLFALGATRGRGMADAAAAAKAIYGTDVERLMRGALLVNMDHEAMVRKASVDPSLSNDDAFDEYAAVSAAIFSTITDSFIGAQLGAHRTSFTDQTMTQAIAASASWVGNGRLKPITRTSFAGLVVPPAKLAATIVVPADAFVTARADLESALVGYLTAAAQRRLNGTFASSSAATTDAPAGIGAGSYAVTSTGTTSTTIIADIASMIDAADSLDSSLADSAFIASPKAYARLRLDRIASDDGSLAGRPLLSARGAQGLMLVDASRVALAMDDRVAISRSEHATVEMSDDPEADTGTTVSLFQKNLVALRAELFVNWSTFGGGEGTNAAPAVVSLDSASWT